MPAKIITVAVGSKNPVKVNAGELGFSKLFPAPEYTLVVEGFGAPSGVPDQPVGDKETKHGAMNRAKACWDMYVEAHGGQKPNFAVGMEGGIEGMDASSVDAMTCFAYITIYDGEENRYGSSKTATFDLPEKMATLVRSGMELGTADDRVMGTINSKQGDGTVGALTNGLISRTDYYVPAVVMAFIPFNHPSLYEK
jgi:inosine/xanthosine triphosphatase